MRTRARFRGTALNKSEKIVKEKKCQCESSWRRGWQLSELRELETELGSGHHKMESGEERISKQGEAESKNDNTSEAKSSKKYVAGAAVGAAGATVLASVVSES